MYYISIIPVKRLQLVLLIVSWHELLLKQNLHNISESDILTNEFSVSMKAAQAVNRKTNSV